MIGEFIYRPPAGAIEILHQDDALVFVNKPTRLLSVPGRADDHQDCLQSRMWEQVPGTQLIHRLDLDTSGVMVFARTKAAQRHLNLQFEKRQTKKTYLARVAGQMAKDAGTVDLKSCLNRPMRPLQMVDEVNGRQGITHWRVLARDDVSTRVEMNPETGRTHQLRLHMQVLGHAILGDRFYAEPDVIAMADRLCLHAASLTLFHPNTGDPITVCAPCEF